MKKLMKKLIAMAAALVMIVTLLPAMGVNAQAEPGRGSVTITKNDTDNSNGSYGKVAGAKFTFYKIASYTVGVDGYADWAVEKAFESLNITADDLGNLSTEEIESKVDIALDLIKTNKITGRESAETNDAGQVRVSDLSLGYYLVVETKTPTNYVASRPFFVAVPSADNYDRPNSPAKDWIYDIEVAPKNEKIPPIEKEADVTSAELGQDVTYTITGPAVPTYDESYDSTTLVYSITDTMSQGLTFNNDIEVYKESISTVNKLLDTDYEVRKETTQDNETKIVVSLKSSDVIRKLAGKEIIVKYSAKINENAVVGFNAITNEAELDYTNSPGTTFDGDPITNKVYSFKIKVNKTGEKNAPLKGALFGLYSDAGCTTKIAEGTSDETGKVEFMTEGKEITLKATKYYLKELSAPNGYTILATPFEVEIVDNTSNNTQDYDFSYKLNNGESKHIENSGVITVKVHNNKGFSLPETGGMGTYLFTIGGIVIMAGAAFALIAMKKRA